MRKIKPEKVDALRTLVTGAFGSDANAEEVVYLENQSPVSKADIDAKYAEMLAEYDAKSYARARASQYPSITDVVVALAEKEEGDDTMWQEITAQRAKVKSDNPKPE